MNKTEIKILNDLIKNSEGAYISAINNICYRSYAPLEYYYMICNKLKLNIKCISGGLSYEADKPGANYSIDWVEHDLILAFNQEDDLKQFIYKHNDIEFKLLINCKNIITSDTFRAIKTMIHEDRLFILEDDYKGIYACDTHCYDTNYSMFDIFLNPTFTSDDAGREKIIACEIKFDLKTNPDNKVYYYNKAQHKNTELLLDAICN